MRSLGWVEMAETDLCEGRSSLAVHHCIRQLSYCRRDIRDSAGVWGEVRAPGEDGRRGWLGGWVGNRMRDWVDRQTDRQTHDTVSDEWMGHMNA